MTSHARRAILVCVVGAAGEAALTAASTTARAPSTPLPLLLLFAAGPLLFLALIAWRRRNHETPSRRIYWLSLVLVVLGLGFLGFDVFIARSEEPNPNLTYLPPAIVAVVQWLVVVAIWIGMVIGEGGEKRRQQAEIKKP